MKAVIKVFTIMVLIALGGYLLFCGISPIFARTDFVKTIESPIPQHIKTTAAKIDNRQGFFSEFFCGKSSKEINLLSKSNFLERNPAEVYAGFEDNNLVFYAFDCGNTNYPLLYRQPVDSPKTSGYVCIKHLALKGNSIEIQYGGDQSSSVLIIIWPTLSGLALLLVAYCIAFPSRNNELPIPIF